MIVRRVLCVIIVSLFLGGCAAHDSDIQRLDTPSYYACPDVSTGYYDSPYHRNRNYNECVHYHRTSDRRHLGG
jgi:hypothetical protein